MDGYDNINIRENDNQSIANFIKMATVPGVHDYIYIHYFDEDMKNIDRELAPKVSDKKIKKADRMKLELNKKNSIENIDYYEKKIIQIASNTSFYGLKNLSILKTKAKNKICGDEIEIEVEKDLENIRFETNSCIYTQASAAILALSLIHI
mgnify:CR=1 FL=1